MFGSANSFRLGLVKAKYKEILHSLTSEEVTLVYKHTSKYTAQTTKIGGKVRIFLSDIFFTPRKHYIDPQGITHELRLDTQAGSLIHELSHEAEKRFRGRPAIIEDFSIYGYTHSIQLVQSGGLKGQPGLAVRHADTYEAFAEELELRRYGITLKVEEDESVSFLGTLNGWRTA